MDTHGKAILKEMADKQIPVASVTVSTAVKGYCSKGLLAEAAASLGEAFADKPPGLAAPERPFGATRAAGVRPSSFTLTALVKRYGNAGMLNEAF